MPVDIKKALKLPSYDRRLWILFFGMALNQFGMSIVMPFISIYLYYYQGVSAGLVGFAMFASSFVAGENRGRYQGFTGLTSTLGFAVGPLLGGILLDHFEPIIMWLIIAVLGIACALSFFYLKKMVPVKKNGASLTD